MDTKESKLMKQEGLIYHLIGRKRPYEHCTGSQRPPITSSGEDRHVTRIALRGRAATLRTLSQELRSFVKQVSARRVQRYLQQHGLSAWRPWLRLQ
ncbi:hypothetical protein TNCV_2556911 [Trichonephila clavipes]|nr:hypothetical protein TNCV_2556911 [Trichonephila clavipes]